jgi:hypothetical protein
MGRGCLVNNSWVVHRDHLGIFVCRNAVRIIYCK